MYFYLGKNACPFSHTYIGSEVCVAANGAVRFSCAASAAHFFILKKEGVLLKRFIAAALVVLVCVGLCACEEEKQVQKKTIKEITIEIPTYWEESDSENECLSYYAERTGSGIFDYNTVTLNVEFHVDDDPNYDVSFAGLLADNENMIKVIENKYIDANVLDYEEFETDSGIKGMLYEFSFNQMTGLFSDEAAEGVCFCFASESDRRWFYVTMTKLKDADKHDYEDDFMEMIASIESKTQSDVQTEEEETTVEVETEPVETIPKETEATVPPTTENPNVVMPDDSSVYFGLNPKDVEQTLKEMGFEEIEFTEIVTSDITKPNGMVADVKIDGGEFRKGDTISKNEKVTITCYKVEEQKEEIVFPKDGTKLANDFDSRGSSTVYYINVDGVKNKPSLKKWGNSTVTDGVSEYLDYLVDLGYYVSIESSVQNQPYAGFTVYETNFRVTRNGFSWTMYLCIQDEDYVEYELDIHLD